VQVYAKAESFIITCFNNCKFRLFNDKYYFAVKGGFPVLSLHISIIMAIVIGSIGHAIVGSSVHGGVLGTIVTGFAGAWLGYILLGSWGPVIVDFAVVPAIIGAVCFVFMLGLLSRMMRTTAS
jgi:uncharacterized membrane protein YeaQ/YmgE (transglycosylase-associated protein family)